MVATGVCFRLGRGRSPTGAVVAAFQFL